MRRKQQQIFAISAFVPVAPPDNASSRPEGERAIAKQNGRQQELPCGFQEQRTRRLRALLQWESRTTRSRTAERLQPIRRPRCQTKHQRTAELAHPLCFPQHHSLFTCEGPLASLTM